MHADSKIWRVLAVTMVLAVALVLAGSLLRAGGPPHAGDQTWTGASGPPYWSTAANWNPPGVPSGIGRLGFPAGSESVNHADLDNPAYSFDLYLGPGTYIVGNVIPSCLVTTNPWVPAVQPQVRGNVDVGTLRELHAPIRNNNECPEGTVFDLAAGTEIAFVNTLRMSALRKQGPGTLYVEEPGNGVNVVGRPSNAAGVGLQITAGTLQVDATLPASPVTLQAGVLAGSGMVGAVTATGGTVSPEASPFTEEPTTSRLSVRRRELEGTAATLSTGSLNFSSSTTAMFQLDGNTTDVNQDRLVVTGIVSLGDATLTASFGSVPMLGTVFVIIVNDGTDPVVGTFKSLPEGATIPISEPKVGRASGSIVGRISYVGGTGNDVTITAITDVPVMPHAMLFVLGAIVLAIGMRQLRSRAR